ncbi:MAG: nuclear transport factor 2 family protein [Gaiellales bacterium]
MHTDAQLVLTGFQAFAEGDMDTMRALFHDGAVWHAAGRSRFSGDYEGVDAILGHFTDISSEAQIETEIHAVLADDDHVVVLTKGRLTKDATTQASDGFFVFHVTEGKVSEAWAGAFDPYAGDEFWGAS